MFRGSHNLTLDSRGRIMLPVRVRALMQAISEGQVYVTIHSDDPCLLIYPTPYYLEIEKKIDSLPNLDNPDNCDLQRFFMGKAGGVEIDGNGRLLIPNELRKNHNLEKSLVLAGVGRKLELWNEADWIERFDAWRAARRNRRSEERYEPIEFSL